MTSRKIPESAVENLVSDLEGKANVSLSNLSAAGQAKFDAKANVSNTVTTDTTQTIAGAKVFTTELRRKSPVIDITTQSENYTANNGFKFLDKNDNIMGFLENSIQADGRIKTAIHAKNKDNYQPNLSVWVPQSGTTGAYATAPSTPAHPGDTVIVTADYLKNNYVTLNTAQTISGVKTFNSGTLQALRPILLKEDNANEGGQIHFQRSNNSVLKDNPYIDLLINTIRFIGVNSKNDVNITLQVDLQNKQVLVPTPALTANDTQAATTAWVRNAVLLTGEIIIWSAPTPPAGYLVCNGAAISRTTYARLFNVIGTTWGAGDGKTTFNLPNLVDRAPWYSGTVPVGRLGNGHLPNITGVFTGDRIALSFTTSGAFYNTTSVARGNPGGSDRNTAAVGFDASHSSQVYSNVDRVIPAFATCLYCIRY